MKRNFLKNSLAAFAFSLAIIASFAFSPNLSNAEDAVIEVYGQEFNPNPACVFLATIYIGPCSVTNTGQVCTYGANIIFAIKSGTFCIGLLREPYIP